MSFGFGDAVVRSPGHGDMGTVGMCNHGICTTMASTVGLRAHCPLLDSQYCMDPKVYQMV